jgi:type III secretion protein J
MDFNSFSDNKAKMIFRVLAISLILFGLAGCTDQVLYSNLTEREANEMIALLYKKGISATKSVENDRNYSVSIKPDYFSLAVELLRSQGYPRNQFESLGEVFKKEGFVSSPLEERARLNYAQSQELARTIESIDGVVLARVHLAIPEQSDLNETQKPSSASVFLKHRRGIDLSDREAQIKALIVNSIEGLPYENVTVAMFSTDPVPVFNKKIDQVESDVSLTPDIQLYLLVLLGVLVLCLSGLSAWLWVKYSHRSSQQEMARSEK